LDPLNQVFVGIRVNPQQRARVSRTWPRTPGSRALAPTSLRYFFLCWRRAYGWFIWNCRLWLQPVVEFGCELSDSVLKVSYRVPQICGRSRQLDLAPHELDIDIGRTEPLLDLWPEDDQTNHKNGQSNQRR